MKFLFCAGHWSVDFNGLTSSATVHLSLCVRRGQPRGLSADGTYGVRHGLQGHAKFGSEIWHGSWRELEMKPLEHCGEEKKHFHPGQLLTQTLTSSYKNEGNKMFKEEARLSCTCNTTALGRSYMLKITLH